MTASVTRGRALRYAGGSARGLLHHHPGHCHGTLDFRGASVDVTPLADGPSLIMAQVVRSADLDHLSARHPD